MGGIVRQYGRAFVQRYPPENYQVPRTLQALGACRTAALGGHVTRCRHCEAVDYHYHSCGDRHCPQCGGKKRAAWLEKRSAELLPVPYFHVVCTLPHQLSALVLGNRKLLYRLLFQAASQTLLEVAADPKHLGARLGVLMVLHTWGQQLEHHPHVHCVVPGGGLAVAEASGPEAAPRWVACRPNWFLPVRVLGRVFRGKYLAGLRQAFARGELRFAGSTAALAEAPAFENFLRPLSQAEWVVYAKEPFGGPAQVLKYLTRYTHRVAIGNSRLVKLEHDQVTFTYKDYADGCQTKELTLEAVEFVRRFALHILPRGLVRIRQYGLLANRDRQARLDLCRQLLAAAGKTSSPAATVPETATAEDLPEWSPHARRCLVPCLLLALLLQCVQAGLLPPGVLADLVAPLLHEFARLRRTCPVCGVGELETIWQAPRPTRAELDERWDEDTS